MPLLNDLAVTQAVIPSDAPHPTLAIWRLTETFDELCEMLPQGFGYQAEAVRRFSSDSRRREWLAARVLLHSILEVASRIDYTAAGAPFLPGNDLRISISHTQGYVVVAIHTAPLGLDIERRGTKAHAVLSKFLAESEASLLPEIPSPHDRATVLWSAKESAFKFFATGNPDLKNGIRLKAASTSLLATDTISSQTAHLRYSLHPDFILTLAIGN